MKLRSVLAVAALAASVLSFGAAAQADTVLSFDAAGDTAGWVTDRYQPQVFQSGVSGGGRSGVLQLGLREAGQKANRAGSFANDFYNYQGMKLDLGIEAPAAVSVDMYVDSGWANGTRAGMWVTNSNGNLSYPIIEYVVDSGGFTGFRYWQSNVGWTNTGVAAAADAWHNLSIQLSGGQVLFSIDGSQFASVGAQGAHRIDNVILQGHNQGLAGQYDIYFDNLQASAVPLPAAAPAGLAMMAAVAMKRRGRQSA